MRRWCSTKFKGRFCLPCHSGAEMMCVCLYVWVDFDFSSMIVYSDTGVWCCGCCCCCSCWLVLYALWFTLACLV